MQAQGHQKQMLTHFIERAGAGRALTRAEAETVMDELLSGRLGTPEIKPKR